MRTDKPDIDALTNIVIDVAWRFGREGLLAEDARKLVESLLFSGAGVWSCYLSGILLQDEVCSRFLGDLETHIRHTLAMEWSENRDWLTPTLERRVAVAMGFVTREDPHNQGATNNKS